MLSQFRSMDRRAGPRFPCSSLSDKGERFDVPSAQPWTERESWQSRANRSIRVSKINRYLRLKLVQDGAVKRFLGYSSVFRGSKCFFNLAHRTLFTTRSCFIVQRGQRPTWPLDVATVIISLLVSSLSTVEKVYTHDIYLRHAHWHQIV